MDKARTSLLHAGPRIITLVVDGQVCDGGAEREYGWGRFSPELADVNGDNQAKVAPTLRGRLLSLRIYDQPLRNLELVANIPRRCRARPPVKLPSAAEIARLQMFLR